MLHQLTYRRALANSNDILCATGTPACGLEVKRS